VWQEDVYSREVTQCPSSQNRNEEVPLLPDSLDVPKRPTPLPKIQIVVLLLTCLIEPIASQSILPYINQVRDARGTLKSEVLGDIIRPACVRARHRWWRQSQSWLVQNCSDCDNCFDLVGRLLCGADCERSMPSPPLPV
jgi:hypothetical protein